MADSEDIIEYSSNEEEDSDYEEEEEDEPTDTSDVPSLKPSNYKDISTNVEDIQENIKNISTKISAIKRRYTRRISLFEVVGIIAESYNLLQRGRLPLILDLSDETMMKNNIIRITIKEIKDDTCPIIIEKNGELLSTSDFDRNGLMYHLDYIIRIWKKQNRY
ncbi:RNA polymerase subunit RPO19 [Swinepox virus]|uniref:DNA-directed RNA polymerase 19 kDa subunit n=1 Tax=Swinepox virus TaxID=10276 RepID=A0A881SY39_SWPV|nr:RNA polymerase subunit RPO19 [Swinepox virus]